MLYYEPENHGLETVAEFEAYEPDWSFDVLVVWRETATGKFYAAADSGCSCPVPFEDHTFPTDFTAVRSWADVKQLLDSEFPRDGSYRPRKPHNTFRQQVKRVMG